jgi:hypothetical protein
MAMVLAKFDTSRPNILKTLHVGDSGYFILRAKENS